MRKRLAMETWQNDVMPSTNANGRNGRGHGHSVPVNQFGQTQVLSGITETPMEEMGGHVAETQVTMHGDGVVEGGERPRTVLPKGFYEVEAIRSKRVKKGGTQYLIKWLGWPETDNTWEPVKNLHSVSKLIDGFEESLISARQSKRTCKQAANNRQRKHQSTSLADFDHGDVANTLPQSVAFGGEDNNGEKAGPAVADTRNGNGDKNQVKVYEDNIDVVEIIKPLDYLPPHATNFEEHFITFLGLRSDGAETFVSNEYLKKHNPQLLLNYYEQMLTSNEACLGDIAQQDMFYF